ncbi:aminotransferase class I and II [Hymenobacter lapidarius]|uniref:Aminotransferase class I and II n=1 Tax=Hymenobacter lapidarius TaxID=1908237 RepID=A0A1G1T4B3_9BACT|nr:HipA family kinase [Hymenobacter lapidarius]OGX85708.1 aminotransferase class I and II [Hymenobacter lapidarius]
MPATSPLELRTVAVTRYVTPLREGGSLPALVEADDNFLYVLKFRGAGQGVKALIAELIVGEIARVLGLRVPELVFCELDEAFGRTEPDEEIQDLLRASTGRNLALHYLSGAVTFDALVTTIAPRLASQIVWLDCLTLNVDRTARNTNLLMWHKELWLIDHGAALYAHHAGPDWAQPRPRPFPQVKDHVLLPQASELAEVDAESRAKLPPDILRAIVALVPDEWLTNGDAPAAAQRADYVRFLETRLTALTSFVQEAQDARNALI